MESNVRVRFAPSPTGFFHIGSARTALFNWLFAKKMRGTFVLRIEDTDNERNSDEFLRMLMNDLEWLGLTWDEGPNKEGEFGPYFQSKRADLYNKYLEVLQNNGSVYEKDGAIWLKVSGEMQVIDDIIRGKVERLEEKDFVIFRSNGTPVFHFVNVVDDISMNITHVIRGEDHLSNTSKHIELYKAFGATIPKFAHIPLILKTDGPGKMSKRDKGALIEDYKRKYFLPAAIINYLSLLGWSPKNDKEFIGVDEIIELFDLAGVNKNNARFDEKKLNFLNAEHLKKLPRNDFFEESKKVLKNEGLSNYLDNEAYLEKILSASQEKLRSFDELPNFIGYFFDFNLQKHADLDAKEKAEKQDYIARIKDAIDIIEQNEFESTAIEQELKNLSKSQNIPIGHYIHSIRFAISGKSVGPSLFAILDILGKKETLSRLNAAMKTDAKLRRICL